MERLWYIKHCRLFDVLTSDQLARLERRARVRRFAKNVPVYLPNDAADAVLLLAEGRVKLCSTTPEGKRGILAFVEAGEVFGELTLVGEAQREEVAETVVPSTIVWLPGNEVETLMGESPQLTLGVSKLIGLRRKRVERRLKTLLFRSNRDRLVHLLLDLAEQYGEVVSEGVHLSIRLSQQDLASIIGATRESVTTLLGQLQLEGLLKVARQRIVIRDLRRLADLTDAVAPAIPQPPADPSSAAAGPAVPLRN